MPSGQVIRDVETPVVNRVRGQKVAEFSGDVRYRDMLYTLRRKGSSGLHGASIETSKGYRCK